MPALKNVIKETRSILKWGGIFFVTLFLLWVFITLGTSLKDKLFPPPPTRPEAGFGKLPPIIFSNNPDQNPTLPAYSLNTLSGTLPTFPDRIKVYAIESVKPSLLALEKMQQKVSDLGFTTKGTSISESTYQWKTQDPFTKEITVNIYSSDFTFSSSLLSTPNILPANDSDKSNAINLATSFIQNLTSLPNDLDSSKTQASILTASGAKVIRVDFFQKDFQDLPIYYPNDLPMSVTLGKKDRELQVTKASFIHQIPSSDSSTYPIKTTSEAFENLKNGYAYIDQNPNNLTNVVIKQATLGYFLGSQRQGYLMPVIEFSGDKFKAYVSAVKDDFVGK